MFEIIKKGNTNSLFYEKKESQDYIYVKNTDFSPIPKAKDTDFRQFFQVFSPIKKPISPFIYLR